jgi:hypothetical protein
VGKDFLIVKLSFMVATHKTARFDSEPERLRERIGQLRDMITRGHTAQGRCSCNALSGVAALRVGAPRRPRQDQPRRSFNYFISKCQ